MLRRTILLSPLAIAIKPAHASVLLLTPAEISRERTAKPPLQTRAGPDPKAPEIIVEAPTPSSALPHPFAVRLRFVSPTGAAIDAKSFHAAYGWLGVDITSRLLQHATLSPTGLSTDQLEVPPGEYRVQLSVADASGRVGTEQFHFKVV